MSFRNHTSLERAAPFPLEGDSRDPLQMGKHILQGPPGMLLSEYLKNTYPHSILRSGSSPLVFAGDAFLNTCNAWFLGVFEHTLMISRGNFWCNYGSTGLSAGATFHLPP